ncbi:zincin-like metallopeptidase domain-containing protein [Mesorhizobium sp. M0847]|uniref:ArdC family protein n=1 Tax=unclassified Mesorhizobium TaxID=325217 RepID=UPI00333BC55D
MPTKRDTYQIITDTILEALETCGPCERPWVGPSLTMPVNAVSGHEYRGTNVVMLWLAAREAGYPANAWATFKQWSERGATVRKGEKGTPIIWFQMLERKDADDADTDEDGRRIPCARLSWVFNAGQVDGYQPEQARMSEDNQVSPIAQADALVAASRAKITHEGAQAFYRPGTDEIVLPPQHLFTGTSTSSATEAYYGVMLHELTHWTAPRLQREFGMRFGDNAYAAEELVAELGAAFLGAKLGIEAEPRADHAKYLASWIKLLKGDRRAFITAASKASEASDYLLAFRAREVEDAA